MRRLTRAGAALAGAGLTLLGLGMGTANLELLLAGTLPLLLLAATLADQKEGAPRAELSLSTRTPRRGDPIECALATTAGTNDIIEVHTDLPDSFALESGNNLTLRATTGRAAAAFRVRAQTRGKHPLGPVRAEQIDPSGLLAPIEHNLLPDQDINVQPRLTRRGTFRGRLRTRGRLAQTTQERARLGARSTDFKELRDYAWGDPPSSIHWKATARRMSARASATPVVSEYEHEGRRTVLVLLDGGAPLRVGNSAETGLDHAIEAALTLASHHLDHNARVGAATYGARSGGAAYPESGEGHFARLERALDPGAPDKENTLARTLERLHGHMRGGMPYAIVFTRVTPENVDGIVHAARRFRGLIGEKRRVLPLLVIDVRALRLTPQPDAAWSAARELVEQADARAAEALRQTGARLMSWAPREEDLLHAYLARQGR